MNKYKPLKPGEILQRGDQFLINGSTHWLPTGLVGYPVLGLNYRRPVGVGAKKGGKK